MWKRQKFKAGTPQSWVMSWLWTHWFLPLMVRMAIMLPTMNTSPEMNFLLFLVREGYWWWINSIPIQMILIVVVFNTLLLCFTLTCSFILLFVHSAIIVYTPAMGHMLSNTWGNTMLAKTQACPQWAFSRENSRIVWKCWILDCSRIAHARGHSRPQGAISLP